MKPEDLTSFNQLFYEAERRGVRLDRLIQNDAGMFKCAWRDGTGSLDVAENEKPFLAMRDAFMFALGQKSPLDDELF